MMKSLLEQNDPILRKIAEPIEHSDFNKHWLKDLVQELFRIMEEKAAVGVAAPQIGVSKRVIVFGTAYTKSRNVDKPIPNTVLINPTLKVLSETIQVGYEGCLNCGELRAEVPRAMEVLYSGFDLDGNEISRHATDLEARIVQHEIDHLNGKLFIDHVVDKNSITTATELQQRLVEK